MGVEAAPAQILLHLDGLVQRREGPLFAVRAIAQAAGHADGHGGLVQHEPVGIDQLPGVRDGAAQAQGLDGVLAAVVAGVLLEGARDAEVLGAVGHFADLGADEARREEGGVDVPARAAARVPREADARA